MIKSRNYSQYKIRDPPKMVQYDGEESKFNKRVFRGILSQFNLEHSLDKVMMCWEYTPMNKDNDLFFQKPNYVQKTQLDQIIRQSYELPQIHKRKNQLQNETHQISPQITENHVSRFGKYAKRYTQDSDLFSTKFSSKNHFMSEGSHYGAFYFAPDYKLTKQKPCLSYHTSKSQILGNKRLELIKLKQEGE